MTQNRTYGASWGLSLKIMTGIAAGILLFMVATGLTKNPGNTEGWTFFMVVLPLAVLGVSSLFSIHGYTVDGDTLLIHRIGWNSKVNLSRLVAAHVDPSAMNNSIRTFGNGGMFCFAGGYWNKKLRHYRAFATAPKNSVILRFPNRTVVVSPDDPAAFAEEMQRFTATS